MDGTEAGGYDADSTAIDEATGLPNHAGWLAVLRMEERRAWRHGGDHAIGLIEFGVAIPGPALHWAVDAVIEALRETDVVAAVGPARFAVLALHCADPDSVRTRIAEVLDGAPVPLGARIRIAPAGCALLDTWVKINGSLAVPSQAGPRHRDFVPPPARCLN